MKEPESLALGPVRRGLPVRTRKASSSGSSSACWKR